MRAIFLFLFFYFVTIIVQRRSGYENLRDSEQINHQHRYPANLLRHMLGTLAHAPIRIPALHTFVHHMCRLCSVFGNPTRLRAK